jgi:hypothetical protein
MALQSADVNALARLDGAGAGNEVSSTLLCCVALSCIVQVRKVSQRAGLYTLSANGMGGDEIVCASAYTASGACALERGGGAPKRGSERFKAHQSLETAAEEN